MRKHVTLSAMKKTLMLFIVSAAFTAATSPVLACDASFYTIDSGSNVYFVNTSTASNSSYWTWSFGDGTGSDLKNPYHQYNSFGPYYVCLTVHDTAANCVDYFCDSIYLNGNGYSCSASFSFTTQLYTAVFTNTSVAGNGALWYWSFGDGTYSTDQNPTHEYSTVGTFYVCLTVSDTANNCTSDHCGYVTISGGGCQAYFYYSDSSTTVYFDNFSQSVNTPIYSWSFGDGTYSDLENPVHEYNGFGPYSVCLTIYDTVAACSSTYCDSVYINNNNGGNCQAYFSYVLNGYDAHFANYSTSCGNNPVWQWSFGDGTGSSNFDPWHTYASSGYYYVCLTVTDTSCNCNSTYCSYVFVGNNNNGCHSEFVLIPDSTQQGLYWGYNYSTGQNLTYYWWWGDGSYSTEQYPTHEYQDSGYYNICLSIFDTVSYCSDSFCTEYFIMKQAKMDQIHEVIFVNTTGVAPVNNHAAVSWDIFPNPAENNIRIQSNATRVDEIRITDVSGRILKRILNYNGENISVESLPQEALIVQTLIDGTWSSKLLMKQ